MPRGFNGNGFGRGNSRCNSHKEFKNRHRNKNCLLMEEISDKDFLLDKKHFLEEKLQIVNQKLENI